MINKIQEVASGLRIGTSHVIIFMKYEIVLKSLKIIGLYKIDSIDHAGELKVIGVGYGRTGTLSLSMALTELGYPTLHTYQLVANKFDILEMWAEKVFIPAIEGRKLSMGSPDFDIITAHGYTATADLPTSLYYEQLQVKYPDCKFILTTRDNSEVWFRSWNVMVTSTSWTTTYIFQYMFHHVRKVALYFRWLSAIVNDDTNMLSTPLNQPLPVQNKHRAIASYEEHNRRVREVIPSHRLLEYNVKDGWAPLCQFLEITDNCPHSPFPNTNTSLVMKVQTMSSFLVPLSLLLFVLFTSFAFGFKRLTGLRFLQWFEKKWFRLLGRTKAGKRRGRMRIGEMGHRKHCKRY